MELTIPRKQADEINKFCQANNIEDVTLYVLNLIKKGFDLEKWGDLNTIPEEEPEIVQVPIPKITKTIDIKPPKIPIKEKHTIEPIENQINEDLYGEE